MIRSSEESINTVLNNIDNSIDYYINQHTAGINGASRLRNDAMTVKGLVEYRSALKALLEENYSPKKKRGNPNFGKDNPYLNKEVTE